MGGHGFVCFPCVPCFPCVTNFGWGIHTYLLEKVRVIRQQEVSCLLKSGVSEWVLGAVKIQNRLGDMYTWMFPKIVGFPPKSSILIGFYHENSPSILGYPYFWKHPHGDDTFSGATSWTYGLWSLLHETWTLKIRSWSQLYTSDLHMKHPVFQTQMPQPQASWLAISISLSRRLNVTWFAPFCLSHISAHRLGIGIQIDPKLLVFAKGNLPQNALIMAATWPPIWWGSPPHRRLIANWEVLDHPPRVLVLIDGH